MHEANIADSNHLPDQSQNPDQGARIIYDQASELRRRGQPQEALRLLDSILHQDPDDVAARYALVVCLTDLGRTAEAASHLLRVLDAVPGHYEAAYRLGRILQADADPAGAAAYRRVLEITEFRDARARLHECEQASSGAGPDSSPYPAGVRPATEVPTPLRTRVDDRQAVDRGSLIAGLRLQARYLAPAMLGKALLATVAAIPLVVAYAGGVSGPSSPVSSSRCRGSRQR